MEFKLPFRHQGVLGPVPPKKNRFLEEGMDDVDFILLFGSYARWDCTMDLYRDVSIKELA